MGTPAAVYIESKNQAIRINYDGYREHMIPTLTRIVAEGLLDEFASQKEYSSLSATAEDYARELEWNTSANQRYVNVDKVGFAYSGDIIEIVPIGRRFGFKNERGQVIPDDFEYAYIITKTGEVNVYWLCIIF